MNPRTVQHFRDIVVMPTQALLNVRGNTTTRRRSGIYRGGPIWPSFSFRARARHCRGLLSIPLDTRPVRDGEPTAIADAGIWCGPVSPHFGHMIADFGMRIAHAAHRTRDIPLVFSVGPEPDFVPPPFFDDMLAHLGVPKSRVLLVREPTLFRTLQVAPQSERLDGPGPSATHLDLMDEIVASHPPAPRDIACLFVSRALMPDGRLVAEGFLDDALGRAGVRVIHPETLDLRAQLGLYRRARTIVFSEGSALHGLQLLGRLDARIVILLRRSGTRIARRALRARVRQLDYWDLGTGQIFGRAVDGRRHIVRALTLFDADELVDRCRGLGIDLARHWDRERFEADRDADIRRWIDYMRLWNLHPSAPDTIQECLRKAGIDIAVDEIWTPIAEPPLHRAVAAE